VWILCGFLQVYVNGFIVDVLSAMGRCAIPIPHAPYATRLRRGCAIVTLSRLPYFFSLSVARSPPLSPRCCLHLRCGLRGWRQPTLLLPLPVAYQKPAAALLRLLQTFIYNLVNTICRVNGSYGSEPRPFSRAGSSVARALQRDSVQLFAGSLTRLQD